MSDNDLTLEDSPRKPNQSGSLCPAVKAADMIGDKWTLLIMRELLLGTNRYNAFQRALPRISPTVLSKRLKQMEEDGLIIKKAVPGEKATIYHLTKCGRELAPLPARGPHAGGDGTAGGRALRQRGRLVGGLSQPEQLHAAVRSVGWRVTGRLGTPCLGGGTQSPWIVKSATTGR